MFRLLFSCKSPSISKNFEFEWLCQNAAKRCAAPLARPALKRAKRCGRQSSRAQTLRRAPMGQHQAKPAEVPPPPLITLPSAPAGSHGRASLTLPSIIYERGTATSFTDTDEPVTTSDDEGLASATDEEELAPATDELESDNEEPALATDTPKEGGTQPKEGGTQPKEGGTDEPPARSSSARTSSTQPSFRALPFPARHSDTRDTADEMSAEEVQDFMSKYRGTTLGHLLPFSPVCQTRPDKPRQGVFLSPLTAFGILQALHLNALRMFSKITRVSSPVFLSPLAQGGDSRAGRACARLDAAAAARGAARGEQAIPRGRRPADATFARAQTVAHQRAAAEGRTSQTVKENM
ncbi:hypothetical protein T492DRAFT_850216 [Pavlovales sp. CCMP2436]|nr:hypothetical protein T492DRAFT_850216 [Pavlovales sp. CCMP2436]